MNNCINCGKEINKRTKSKLCRKCVMKGRHNYPLTEFKKGIKEKLICNNCNKEIFKNKSEVRNTHNFCSRNCYVEYRFGKNRIIWKGRLKEARLEYFRKNKIKLLLKKKEFRHKIGFSKKYISENCFSHTKEYRKLQRQKRKALIKGGGILSIKTIQLVYEDNIKKYGTLTCYLCLQSIPFGKDHLEHKTPLSRGGTNEYNNLGIACQRCNCTKNNKTEKEYREGVLK